MLSPIVANAPINALLFAVEGICVTELRRRGWHADAAPTHIIAGGISGLSQTVLASPSELVKIRLQCQIDTAGADSIKGPWEMARSIIRTEGASALFRGFSLTCARDIPAFSIYFTSYWYLKQLLANKFVWMRAPVKPKQTRAVAAESTPPSGERDRLSELHKVPVSAREGQSPELRWPGEEEPEPLMEFPGERGSWQGGHWESDFTVQAARRIHGQTGESADPQLTPVGAAQGGDVGEINDDALVAPPQLYRAGPAAQLLAGGLAGTASWLFLHPVDVLKSVVQRQTVHTPPHLVGPLRAAAFHLRNDGPSFFLRGIVPTCLRAFPASAVIFLVYETVRPLLRF